MRIGRQLPTWLSNSDDWQEPKRRGPSSSELQQELIEAQKQAQQHKNRRKLGERARVSQEGTLENGPGVFQKRQHMTRSVIKQRD